MSDLVQPLHMLIQHAKSGRYLEYLSS